MRRGIVRSKKPLEVNGLTNSSINQNTTGLTISPPDYGITAADQPMLIQPKLTIGPVNDQYEREADRIAEQVMRMPAPEQLGQTRLGETPRPAAAHGVLQRTRREPPFNGKVDNRSDRPVRVHGDRGNSPTPGFYHIPPHSQSDFRNDDVDFIEDQYSQWYKIGALTTLVAENGYVSNYVCRAYPPGPPRYGECFPPHG
ncbi:MAG: hypothetical protein GY807_11515, partial [Gammaproteobacteria bacterium]|nr:hypothetical protein [Gammaproteobacteria bacterium]